MADLGSMTVEIPEPLASEIRAAVEAGDYASSGDAVGEAVGLWSAGRRMVEPDAAALRSAWDAGKAGGLHGPLDFIALRQEAEARLAAARLAAARAASGRGG